MWILSPSDLRGASWCWNRTENCRHKVRKDDDASAETPAVWRPTEATQQLVVQRVYSERCQKEHVYCFPLICWRCRYVQMHVVLIHVTLASDDHFKVPHKQREVTSFHRHPAILITSQEVKRGNTSRPTVLHIRTSVVSEGGGFMLNKYPLSFCDFCFHVRSCHTLNQYLCSLQGQYVATVVQWGKCKTVTDY